MDSNLQRTELYSSHVKLNAKMVPFAGFEMPIQYHSLKEETWSVRHKVGMFDVSHMGEFFVEGPEALSFVDYLVTNDIGNAASGKAIYSPLCRANGTIIDDLIVYKLSSDRLLICVNASNIQKDWDHFSAEAKRFRCQIHNRSQEMSLLAIQGPLSEAVLRTLKILPADEMPYYAVREISWGKEKLILARTGYTGEDGFEIFCTHGTAVSLWELFLQEKVAPCGLGARDILRLEVGFPLYGHELTDELTPLDSGLKWTVKFEKNAFLGKETLLHYRPKFQLAKLTLEKGIPRAGYEVENAEGESVGTVSSGTLSPTINKGIALAHIKKEKFPQNIKDLSFLINIRNNKFPAIYHQKAFVMGGHK